MTRDFTLPKSAPVQSPLAQSTKQLRIPQIRSPPQTKRFAHLPEIHTKHKDLRTKSASPDESPFRDKKRLVDQFYELASPGTVSLKTSSGVTPTISRSNTVEDLSTISKFKFLKGHSAEPMDVECDDVDDDGAKCVMKSTVDRVEAKVLTTVKHRSEESELEMTKTRTHFQGVKDEITQMKDKVKLYISLLEDKSKAVEERYEKLQNEITNLYKTLSTLDQYEDVVESSRTKMLESKRKLQDLTMVVERAEVMNVEQREKLKVTKKWVVMSLGGLVLMYLFKCIF